MLSRLNTEHVVKSSEENWLGPFLSNVLGLFKTDTSSLTIYGVTPLYNLMRSSGGRVVKLLNF